MRWLYTIFFVVLFTVFAWATPIYMGKFLTENNGYVQDQLNNRCLESIFGTSLNSDDLKLTGTDLECADEVPHTDVNEIITGNWELPSQHLTIHDSEPSGILPGDEVWTDSDTWDPTGQGLDLPVKVLLSRDTTELISDIDNREFAPGTANWADGDTDLLVFNIVDDLTITADTIGDECELAGTYAPTENSKKYRVEFDVDTLVSTWTLKDADGTNTICTISANGDNQFCDYDADDSVGGFQIVAVANDSSANFDNFSLNELPYKSIKDQEGNVYYSAIEMPTLEASELDDTSDPHLLIVEELQHKILTNSESVGADEWDFPARTEGWFFMFNVEVAENVTLDPNGTEQWYLNGYQTGNGETIQNTSPVIGDYLIGYSTEGNVYLYGIQGNWAAYDGATREDDSWIAYASTEVGWHDSGITKDVHYKAVGNQVFVNFNILGESDNTTTSFTVPYNNNSDGGVNFLLARMEDSDVYFDNAFCNLPKDSNTVICYKTNAKAADSWTGDEEPNEDKHINGQFWYWR